MLDWNSDTHLVVAGTGFVLAPTDVTAARAEVDAGALLLRKDRWMVERYDALRADVDGGNVFELGIYEGGSAALLALLLRPRRLVAVDIKRSRTPALDTFIEAHGLRDRVHPYYGVDQSDRARLEEIVAEEYGREPLDLVVDDASHLLAETTASFNVLFPRLRPGGLFVIEDWSCQLQHERALMERLRTDEQAWKAVVRNLEAGYLKNPGPPPLGRLVLEIVLTAGYAEGIVAEVTGVREGWLLVRRGNATLDPATFDISQCYGSLGAALLA